MINYDKYEGHTEAKIEVSFSDGDYILHTSPYPGIPIAALLDCNGISSGELSANAHLFADAPDILAHAVKLEAEKAELVELVKTNKSLAWELEGVISDYEHDKSFDEVGFNTVKRVAQALHKTKGGE